MLLVWYGAALAATLVIEVPLYAVTLIRGWRTGGRRAVAAAVAVNLLTHPALWWLLRPWTSHPAYDWIMFGAEGGVCLVEGLLLMAWLRRRDPLLLVLSVAVNGASVLAGMVIFGSAG